MHKNQLEKEFIADHSSTSRGLKALKDALTSNGDAVLEAAVDAEEERQEAAHVDCRDVPALGEPRERQAQRQIQRQGPQADARQERQPIVGRNGQGSA